MPGFARRAAPRRGAIGAACALATLLAACTGQAGPDAGDPQGADSLEAHDPVVLDADAIAGIDRKMTARHPGVRAVLVSVGGDQVAERYYHGASADEHIDVLSITKTVVSMLVGVAIGDGLIDGVDVTVGELLPAEQRERASPDVAAITVEQLLSMTSGLPRSAPGALPAFMEHADWTGAILERGTVIPPGTSFMDSDAAAHLLSVIVAEVAGRSTLAYAEEKLFTPLGIDTDRATRIVVDADGLDDALAAHEAAGFTWPEDPAGYHLGFTALKLTAEDMAKLGQLYLDEGRWGGRQVVPADYVADSTHPVPRRGASHRYGYHWSLRKVGGHEAFAAHGGGGQLIQVIPAYDLVVVISSDPGAPGEDNLSGLRAVIIDEVLPAVGGGT